MRLNGVCVEIVLIRLETIVWFRFYSRLSYSDCLLLYRNAAYRTIIIIWDVFIVIEIYGRMGRRASKVSGEAGCNHLMI